MKTTRYLLIGGGLSSNSAAKSIRKADAEGPILIVSQEKHLPYDRPPLTKKFMQGKQPREKVFLEKPGAYAERHVEVLTGTAVESLDPARKIARLAGGETVAFEQALLATGGRPVRPSIPGMDLPGVHTFRTLDDAEAVSAQASAGKQAVLIGGGFIGTELAASLTQRGVAVTLVQAGPRLWGRFADESLAGYIQDYLAARGVTILTNERVARIVGNGRASSVSLQSGKVLPCDFVVVAIGITPNLELARQAGLETNSGVVVNELLQTTHRDVYAAGDIAEYPDPYVGKRRRVEHWGQAEYTGGLTGANMAKAAQGGGPGEKYNLVTYVWTDLFDLHLEFAGDEAGYDRLISRGQVGTPPFSILYLRGGKLSAYYSVNAAKAEYTRLAKLIELRTDLAGREKQLADPAFDLGGL